MSDLNQTVLQRAKAAVRGWMARESMAPPRFMVRTLPAHVIPVGR